MSQVKKKRLLQKQIQYKGPVQVTFCVYIYIYTFFHRFHSIQWYSAANNSVTQGNYIYIYIYIYLTKIQRDSGKVFGTKTLGAC